MYAAAFRVFKKGLGLKCESDDTSAQELCDEMKEKGVNAYTNQALIDKMTENYPGAVVVTPAVMNNYADAFGFTMRMIDDTKCAIMYQYLTSDEYIDVKYEDTDETTTIQVDFYMNCGFSYNPGQTNVTFAVFYLYAEEI